MSILTFREYLDEFHKNKWIDDSYLIAFRQQAEAVQLFVKCKRPKSFHDFAMKVSQMNMNKAILKVLPQLSKSPAKMGAAIRLLRKRKGLFAEPKFIAMARNLTDNKFGPFTALEMRLSQNDDR